jgi:hypothetical protein
MIAKLSNAHKCIQWSFNIPNDQKICQHFPFQGPQKYTQIGIFGLKRNHLATLNPAVISFARIFYLQIPEVIKTISFEK